MVVVASIKLSLPWKTYVDELNIYHGTWDWWERSSRQFGLVLVSWMWNANESTMIFTMMGGNLMVTSRGFDSRNRKWVWRDKLTNMALPIRRNRSIITHALSNRNEYSKKNNYYLTTKVWNKENKKGIRGYRRPDSSSPTGDCGIFCFRDGSFRSCSILNDVALTWWSCLRRNARHQ